ncbi:MAG: pre-16S rRNA-processing nuclease YqgF [Elainellaceae cyanobacterium]
MPQKNDSSPPSQPSDPAIDSLDASQGRVLIGFDPGRDKCGLAVMGLDQTLHFHDVIASDQAIATLMRLQNQFQVEQLVLGDQTTSKSWKARIEQELPTHAPIQLIDERYTTLEARDRYWAMFPPTLLARLLPQGLRPLPRPIDDIVAILLIERYLAAKRFS